MKLSTPNRTLVLPAPLAHNHRQSANLLLLRVFASSLFLQCSGTCRLDSDHLLVIGGNDLLPGAHG